MNDGLAPETRSDFPDNIGTKNSDTIVSDFKRGEEDQTSKLWKSTALRAPILIFTTLVCWTIIAILHYLLVCSQRDNGIIFAPKIQDLPLGRTFLYLYFPTIIGVIFSIYWAWIDLEAKRLEPYYQLSKKGGALGKDSLLLHYPFDFVPLVPFKAAKDRHWPVFCASLAAVLVTWGVVPIQAGIFSVRTVTRTTNTTFAVSTSSIPIEQQATTLGLGYMQSTYGIVSLNETLPQYMDRNYTLAPFRLSTDLQTTGQASGTWTAPTIKYSLDLYCEDVSRKADNSRSIAYVSDSGCNFTLGLTGNVTKGNIRGYEGEAYANKDYVGIFVGYHNGGFADYSLDAFCDESSNTTFYAAFAKNKARPEDPPEDVTAVFCKPLYYQQAVIATVDMTTRVPLKVEPLADREPLPWHIFNTTMFETLLNAGSSDEIRGDTFPMKSLPRYTETIARARHGQLSLSSGASGSVVQRMVGLALGAGTDTLESYLEWKGLSKAYAEAYRVLFARAMVDVLGTNFSTSYPTSGQQRVTSEAVILEPVFVYIVESLLGLVSIATIALLVLSSLRKRSLRTNMGTIASIMSIVADNEPLLLNFADLDCCPVEEMQQIIGEKRYKLINEDSRTSIIEIEDRIEFGAGPQLLTSRQRYDTPTSIARPVRAKEFSLWFTISFINLFIILAVLLVVIFAKARVNGLPLPSSNTIVQNILENYIPTALATLIEPMWVLINRLLCMLKPLEELQGCKAQAKKSIDLDYSSLPPQLVIFKALKSKHYVLAAVCGMALLSNVLAVAFSGIFIQRSTEVRKPQTMISTFNLKFVSINGSVGPKSYRQFGSHESSGAYEGGSGEDQFLVAESNYTRGTPLPAWTDHRLLYQPFSWTSDSGTSISDSDMLRMEATTKAFGAELDCEQLELGKDSNARIDVDSSIRASINVTVPTEDGDVRCSSQNLALRPGPIKATSTCITGSSAAELVSVLEPRINATQREKDACMGTVVMGWLREPQGLCPFGKNLTITESNSMFVRCRPRLRMGTATIRVDAGGRLVQPVDNLTLTDIGTSNDTLQEVFTNDPINLIGQSNKYLFKYNANGWHNDSFADDFLNYFVRRGSNSSRLVDPSLPPPTFKDVAKPLSEAYSRLFAIWLGTNKDLLLVKSDTPAPILQAWKVEQTQHIFVSMPMFIIAETILCTYAVAALFVYLRRPGQYLARLPISIASMIALFAASSAVQDLQGTSHLNKKGRARHLEAIDSRYGHGSFVGGGDGRVHVGIEKIPFVRVRSKTTWLEKRFGPRWKGSTS